MQGYADGQYISYKHKLRVYGGSAEWLEDRAITGEYLEGAYYYHNTLAQSGSGIFRTILDMKRK